MTRLTVPSAPLGHTITARATPHGCRIAIVRMDALTRALTIALTGMSREPSSLARGSVETDALCGESSSDDPQSRLDEHFKGLDSPDVKFHSYKSLL